MFPLFFCTLICTLCVLPTEASSSWWLPRVSWRRMIRSESLTPRQDVEIASEETSSSANITTPYIFSVPSASIIAPTSTSQGMVVTSIVPIYEVCDTPGKNTTTSCSTVFETITTESCFTVLTYAFTKTTISECVHNVTFSSRTTYALATTTLSAAETNLQPQAAPSSISSPTPITYVQSTVSLYAAPWQSLAADTPGGITVLICISDVTGSQTCVLIEEIWVIYAEYVPVTTTSALYLSTSFSSDVVLLLGPTQSLVASAGDFTLSTLVEFSSMSLNFTTSTVSLTGTGVLESGTASIGSPDSMIRTSTTTSTRTITTTGDTSTITKTLSLGRDVEERTTTLTSTMTLTSTVTVGPMPKL